jgi:moderate conductance mechanosensitive channel
VLKDIGDELQKDEAFQPFVLGPLEVAGIESLGEANVVIRSRMKTVPLKQFDVARELRRRVKIRFERERIQIQFPQREVIVRRPPRPRPG